MTIRVDKCTTFGIKKFSTRSLQFQPSLLSNHAPVPAVKQGESFRYLGRYFDFAMSNQVHKNNLSSLFTELLKEIDVCLFTQKTKFFCIIGLFFLKFLGISLLLTFLKLGFLKTLTTLFPSISVSGSIFPLVPPRVV